MKTLPIGPFLGINNRRPDFALRIADKGDYLRVAENVDIDNAGHIRSREVETRLQAMANPHSLFMTSETGGYMVRASAICAISVSPAYSETPVLALASNARMTWVNYGDSLYFSNGVDSGRITAGVTYPLALPTPAAPALSVTGGGSLAGAHQVVVSYTNQITGEEGGVSPSSSIVSNGGIRVALPVARPGATHVNVYVSAINGSVPMFIGAYVAGTAFADIAAAPTTGREAPQRFEEPLPGGSLFMSGGRLCSFAGSTVYVGLPYRPGYYDAVAGWIPFPAPVTVAVEGQGGTYIAADNTYWVPGDLGNVEGPLAIVLPYGAVPGTEFRSEADTNVGWFGRDGFVLASPSGEVQAGMADHVDLDAPEVGCAVVRSSNGYLRVMGCGWCLNLETMAVTEYTRFDFTSLSQGYGTKADGLYALDGGAGIGGRVALGKLNFGSEIIKRMPAVYLGCASDSPLGVRIKTAAGDDYTYDARSCSEALAVHRVDPGLGLESNWFEVEIIANGAFALASITFAPALTGRRI